MNFSKWKTDPSNSMLNKKKLLQTVTNREKTNSRHFSTYDTQEEFENVHTKNYKNISEKSTQK